MNPALREYLAAPEEVRAAFDAQLAREAAADTDFRRWCAETVDDDPVPPRPPAGRLVRRSLRWNRSWSGRAKGVRVNLRAGGRDFNAERDRLLEIPAVEYAEKLLDEPPERRRVCCPNPRHDDLHPSCQLYEGGGWRCHACQDSGTIYEFAAHLWGLETRGAPFQRLHDQLCEVFFA